MALSNLVNFLVLQFSLYLDISIQLGHSNVLPRKENRMFVVGGSDRSSQPAQPSLLSISPSFKVTTKMSYKSAIKNLSPPTAVPVRPHSDEMDFFPLAELASVSKLSDVETTDKCILNILAASVMNCYHQHQINSGK